MAIYTKQGHRILNESIRIDPDCYFADQVIKIRALTERTKKEKLYWLKDLLADGGKAEIHTTVTARKGPLITST